MNEAREVSGGFGGILGCLRCLTALQGSFSRKSSTSKKDCFEGLRKTVNALPLSIAYRIVKAEIRGVITLTNQSPEMLEEIIEGLYPHHDPSPWPPFVGQLWTGAGDEELTGIAKSLSVDEALGPDEAPNFALKVAIQRLPGNSVLLCRNTWTTEFSKRCRSGRSWFYYQRRGNHPETHWYTPICLIDMYRARTWLRREKKGLEQIILNRMFVNFDWLNRILRPPIVSRATNWTSGIRSRPLTLTCRLQRQSR